MPSPDSKDAGPGTGPTKSDEAARHLQEQLDEALADSFPASDPVSFVTSQTEEDWEEEPASDQEGGT